MKRYTHETFETCDADGACCHLRETPDGELCDADEARELLENLKESRRRVADLEARVSRLRAQ